MSYFNRENQTYSFDSATIAQTLKELVEILTGMGVDITNREQLKHGFDKMFSIEYINMPNLEERSYILAPNHISDFDALLMGLIHTNIKIISKNDWVENQALMSFLSLHYQLIGIDRTSKSSQARALVELIKHLSVPQKVGHGLIFPQGTISNINNNSIERVQSGVFTLSNKSGAPVLPVYIEQPNFHSPTRIVFGQPMPIPEKKQDCREEWKESIIALQNSLLPPARTPALTEKHANNNKPGDPFF